jgi:putative ABC transport system permease protein
MRNSLQVSLRILFKYRLYTGISVVGLSVAISSFWFIANYVDNAYGFDSFQQNANRIYRLTMNVTTSGSADEYATTGMPLGDIISKDYPGLSAYARLAAHNKVKISLTDRSFNEKSVFGANTDALEVFTFDFITGNKPSALSRTNSVILSRSLAEKYFNSVDIINQSITIDEKHYLVKGVFEDWPQNSHLDVKALFLEENLASGYQIQDWFNLDYYNYVLLDPLATQDDLNKMLAQLVGEYLTPELEASGIGVKFDSQLLNDLHFAPALIDDVPKGNVMYVKALALAGFLVLLISGLNFINLTLTQSIKRHREISIKKIFGISRRQLLQQNILESLVMTFLVLIFSVVLVIIFDDLYFNYTGLHGVELGGKWFLIMSLVLLTFLFPLLGTSYNGLYLSFSSNLIGRSKASIGILKKLLLMFQFIVATIIIIATLVMAEQIDFMKGKNLGFSKEGILIVDLPEKEELKTKMIQFRETVLGLSTVQNASLIGGGSLPGQENGKEIFEGEVGGKRTERVFNFYRVDDNYLDLLNIKLKSGRNFQAARASDKTDAVIINEVLAKSMNWQEPIGATLWYDKPRTVIGVVSNFHNKSLHDLIEPVVLIYDENYSSSLLVKTSSANIETIKSVWTSFFPDTPFEVSYFDQFIEGKYAGEDNLVNLLGFFSIVSLVICCTGLFAIFSLHVLQKTREMSIRKVLGANFLNLIKATTRNYMLIALLAISIATPISWFLMNTWLMEFSYKVKMEPLAVIFSASLILLISALTIMYHVIKAITVNLVDTLKCE